MTTLQKKDLKALTDAMFFYIASVKEVDDMDFLADLPESMETHQFAKRIVEHIAAKFEVSEDEVSEKVERIIDSYLTSTA